MPEENIVGPTVLWSELKNTKVKSNDGKKLGKIKKISQNHFRIEKGSVGKRVFRNQRIWQTLMTVSIYG